MPHEDLPPIETWWPRLSVEARHEVLAAPDVPLSERVRGEIRALTGTDVTEGVVLDEHERGFVATQQETVD